MGNIFKHILHLIHRTSNLDQVEVNMIPHWACLIQRLKQQPHPKTKVSENLQTTLKINIFIFSVGLSIEHIDEMHIFVAHYDNLQTENT